MDARNFLYSSDYEMPALVWEYSGSINDIAAYNTKSVTIAHKLPFTPLLIGVWSDNANFNPSYDIANFIGQGSLYGDLQLNQCGADSTNVVVEGYNATANSKNLYFRLLAFAPPDYDGETPNIYDTTNFMFSTDYNYPKIVKSGVVSCAEGEWKLIEHGLGYVPQAKTWGPDAYGRITPLYRMESPDWISGTSGPLIDTTNLGIKAHYAGSYYYHIYGDSSDANS